MAFSKNSNLLMKVGIIVVCAILVLALSVPTVAMMVLGGNTSATASTESTETTDDLSSDDYTKMYEASVEKYETAIAEDPTIAENYKLLGDVSFDWATQIKLGSLAATDDVTEAGLWQKSISAYTSYLELEESSEVRVDKAIATYYNGDLASAKEQLETFTATTTDFAPAWANLGVFYEADGDTDKAREAYQKALESNPDDSTKSFVDEQIEALG